MYCDETLHIHISPFMLNVFGTIRLNKVFRSVKCVVHSVIVHLVEIYIQTLFCKIDGYIRIAPYIKLINDEEIRSVKFIYPTIEEFLLIFTTSCMR